jgi:hypothetical protein
MNESDFSALATEAREQVTPAPVPDLVTSAAARRARRRRGWGTALAAAASVALVIGVVIGVVSLWPGDDNAPRLGRPPVKPAVVAPTGTRLVGLDGVTVAIPASWAQSELGCDTGIRGSVVVDWPAWQQCLELGTYAPSVRFEQADAEGVQDYVDQATIAVPSLDGLRTALLEKDGIDRMALVVPGSDLVVVAEAKDPAVVRQIIESAQGVPPGSRTLPLSAPLDMDWPAMSSLRVTVERQESSYLPGTLLAASPPLGSVVPMGSDVTVTVSSGLTEPAISTERFREFHWLVDSPDVPTPAFSEAKLREKLTPRADGKVRQVFLRTVTITDYGHVQPDGSVEPIVDHRLVWLVISPDALAPMSGPCCAQHPAFYIADWAAIYDATTGEDLGGGSF